MIYQIHPKHGRLMPVSKMEADINEKNGWKTVTEAEFYGESEEINVPRETKVVEHNNVNPEDYKEKMEEIPRSVLVDLYEAKYGKKPHGRMKDETIKAKLHDGSN